MRIIKSNKNAIASHYFSLSNQKLIDSKETHANEGLIAMLGDEFHMIPDKSTHSTCLAGYERLYKNHSVKLFHNLYLQARDSYELKKYEINHFVCFGTDLNTMRRLLDSINEHYTEVGHHIKFVRRSWATISRLK